MICRRRLLLMVCMLLALTMLEGCGHITTTGATVAPTITAEPPHPVGTGSVTLQASATVAPTVTVELSHPAGSGFVTLRTDAPSYRTSDAITVTVSNQRAQTIQFLDHLTNCTVVLLQHNVNGSWESLNLCKLMIVTRVHTLEPGQSLMVKLIAPANQWLPGLYRVSLSYEVPQDSSYALTIYSAIFQIQ
ncbi:MAG TPA: hypothetical protein VIY29_08230 [Ktedonobacteraceae bacterium]